MRAITLAVLMTTSIASIYAPAIAGEEEVYGTWKLVSDKRKILDTGEMWRPAGEETRTGRSVANSVARRAST